MLLYDVCGIVETAHGGIWSKLIGSVVLAVRGSTKNSQLLRLSNVGVTGTGARVPKLALSLLRAKGWATT